MFTVDQSIQIKYRLFDEFGQIDGQTRDRRPTVIVGWIISNEDLHQIIGNAAPGLSYRLDQRQSGSCPGVDETYFTRVFH